MPRPAIVILGLTLGLAPTLSAADPSGHAFFEQKIRPVLVEKCYSCHSAESKKGPKGGLRVDLGSALRKGGDAGPAVIPGKPADSILMKALRGADDVPEMPPSGRLPDAVIADFEKWVSMGAPDPRTGKVAATAGIDLEAGRKFWSYQPVASPSVPAVRDERWSVDPIDRFILSKLEAAGMRPAPDADRATLVRRVYFDLIGLPPTPDEIGAFVADTDPKAYERLVDKLIASPAFGERWGRHWLDVARFGESVTLRGNLLAEAWRYRDYVIDAFNADVPFNRFVREQVAGDLLPAATPADRRRQMIAATYLMLGNNNFEEQDKRQLRMDVVDEQLDAITKGFLAQTVTCARCHDHKFDPIPQADYYALAGILWNARTLERANVSVPLTVPLPEEPSQEAVIARHEAKVAELTARIAAERSRGGVAAAKGALPADMVPGIVVDDTQAKQVGDWVESTHGKTYIGTGYRHDGNAGKGTKTLTFDPDLPATGRYEVRLAYSPGKGRAAEVPVVVFGADGEVTIPVDMTKPPPIDGRFVSLGTFRFEKTGQSFVVVDTAETKGHVTADAVVFLPASTSTTEATQTAATGAVRSLESELAKLKADGPKRQTALGVIEEKAIEDARINVRGSATTLGPVVPRGFLKVASRGPAPAFPKGQSGRVELADWLASADNPLTARVFVNRAWHWLFGAGIVRTVDNFGTTGETPSHPELLDHLATEFVADGWSVKKLVRRIVLSRTYRQATATSDRDPENKLFGRANRRRLDAECLRDAMLAAAASLSDERGGRTFPDKLAADYGFVDASTRRSVYVPAFRNALPELFEAFDFADPSVCTGARSAGTVAPQALFLMNNPFVKEQAKRAAERVKGQPLPDDEARLTWAYRLVLGREPAAGERAAALRHLRSKPDGWADVVHALFASADFRYLD